MKIERVKLEMILILASLTLEISCDFSLYHQHDVSLSELPATLGGLGVSGIDLEAIELGNCLKNTVASFQSYCVAPGFDECFTVAVPFSGSTQCLSLLLRSSGFQVTTG